jgi:peptidase inhibitor family I36
MPRRLATLAAATALSCAVGTLSIAGAASASSARADGPAVTVVRAASQCPAGEFCVWTDSPFRGRFGSFRSGSRNLASFNGGGLNRAITDVWNRSDINFCLFSEPDYFGARLVVYPSSRGHYVGSGWNDRARSIHNC